MGSNQDNKSRGIEERSRDEPSGVGTSNTSNAR
jgi:hypothetical protein